MIRDGEYDRSSNNISCWSKILFGGLIRNMMASSGTWITIEVIWFKLWEAFRAFLSILYSKEHIFQHGRVFSGRKLQVFKSQWSLKSWLMLSVQVWTRFLTEDLLYGGLQPLTELTSILVSRFNLIWQASSCMARFQHWKYLWFKCLELIYGRRSTRVLWWIYVRCSICSYRVLKSIQYRRKLFILVRVIKWIHHVLMLFCLQHLSGKLVNLVYCIKIKRNMMVPLLINIGLMYSYDGVISIPMILKDMPGLSF